MPAEGLERPTNGLQIDDPSPLLGVADLRDEAEHILVAAHLVTATLGLREEALERAHLQCSQHSGGRSAKEMRRAPRQRRWTIQPRAKPHAPLRAILQIDLAVAGLEPLRERPPATPPALETAENELESGVLAIAKSASASGGALMVPTWSAWQRKDGKIAPRASAGRTRGMAFASLRQRARSRNRHE